MKKVWQPCSLGNDGCPSFWCLSLLFGDRGSRLLLVSVSFLAANSLRPAESEGGVGAWVGGPESSFLGSLEHSGVSCLHGLGISCPP